jgi:DnaJ-class molecular chaperone
MHIPRSTQYDQPKPERPCHRCGSTGLGTCQFCGGTGYITVTRDIHGRPVQSRCTACFGSKTCRCYTCGGSGRIL